MLGEFFFDFWESIYSILGKIPYMTVFFISLNILGFAIYIAGDKDTKTKSNKIFKFIEPIGVLYGGLYLVFTSYFLVIMFYMDNTSNNLLFWIGMVLFFVPNWLGLICYFILRFYPLKKLKPVLKLCCYTMIIPIIINIIFTILVFRFSLGLGIIIYLPISASILYLKTLLIVKDDL